MIKIIINGLIISILIGCASSGGELVGVSASQSFYEPNPYRMVFIPQGSFVMGYKGQDTTHLAAQTKIVSIHSFWMDNTEVTNAEYRQFVNWVRDSIARKLLGKKFSEFVISKDKYGRKINTPRINWDTKLDWNSNKYSKILSELYLPDNEHLLYHKKIDTHKLVYEYQWLNVRKAAKKTNRYNFKTKRYEGKIKDRNSFIMKDRVNVYPDTLCWISDFAYSENEGWAKKYFWHPAFDDYPVVGVTYKQAHAFTIWRTHLLNNYLRSRGEREVMAYRLPTEAEWEYAARGGLMNTLYPWKGKCLRNKRGCFLANFKPAKGRYADDGAIATTRVASYMPNNYGLYDMLGNVAEWVSDAFDKSAYSFTCGFNPHYEYNVTTNDPTVMKRKVIRGGSWKDAAYYMLCGFRSYEYQDSARSYVGFRCVQDCIR